MGAFVWSIVEEAGNELNSIGWTKSNLAVGIAKNGFPSYLNMWLQWFLGQVVANLQPGYYDQVQKVLNPMG